MNKELIRKYNVPGPRYTSYPTVPYWEDSSVNAKIWKEQVAQTFHATNATKGIALYIHLPFCESLCHYCGCNVRHTVNHAAEEKYIEYLKKEWLLYLDVLNEKPQITELHLGGGTPTFFSPQNLDKILNFIFSRSVRAPKYSYSFEGDPRNTTREHIETLAKQGFNRMSLGIQDFNPTVQKAINREQTFEQVKEVTRYAREAGYTSVNFDLIYGLPNQTPDTVRKTIEKTNELRPDRIAFYSYAHLPKNIPVQRKIDESQLPTGPEKRALYELGKELFEANGYVEIGMDHFALPHDSLTHAYHNGTLHRNFMGYGTLHTDLMIGLGVSSIGDSLGAFGQNQKTIRNYEKALDQDELPIFRGHLLTDEDLIIRKHILNLMCTFTTSRKDENMNCDALTEAWQDLTETEKDGLIKLTERTIEVTTKGKPFIRNICMALDERMRRAQKVKTQTRGRKKLFSSTV